MARTPKKPRKGKSKAQKNALEAARAAKSKKHDANNIPTRTDPQDHSPSVSLKQKLEDIRTKLKNSVQKGWNTHRKYMRLKKSNTEREHRLKTFKNTNTRLHRELSAAQNLLKNERHTAVKKETQYLTQLSKATAAKQDLQRRYTILARRSKRFAAVKRNASLRARVKAFKEARQFKLTKSGVYTPEARAAARHLTHLGTSQDSVGAAIQVVGSLLGVKVNRTMSERTVGRAVRELGVAADIQSAYEMSQTKTIGYSSDSTSHKHIEYECRTIAMRVCNYEDPNAEPQWQLRSLGVDTSVDHTSETQVTGLLERLRGIAAVFNDSPLAQREKVVFSPEDFAVKLIGTSGDHAADQKKSHRMLQEWRMDALLARMGEEAMYTLDPHFVMPLILPTKLKHVEEAGGYDAWMALSEHEQNERNIELYRIVGRTVFDAMPIDERARMSRFVRTGCCMHKDLNTFKGGDKSMQGFWTETKNTPPLLLANKDNTAVLANCKDSANPTLLEQRAMAQSKRGGTHTTTLGGMICRNKDSKKGQQDTYAWFMEKELGTHLSYPDVSNTRYGTHGEAAAVLVVYRSQFVSFMEFVRDGKEKPGFTNIEKNFYLALQDVPTFTELCVLALYSICVSQPFMRHVRAHDNILTLRGFFKQKAAFLSRIQTDPNIWISPEHTHETATLDGYEWDSWANTVVSTVRGYAPDLPCLSAAIAAFAHGAQTTFTTRFSDEFSHNSDLSLMSEAERTDLYFASTNDVNEGGLGSYRCAQRARPSETLHKFNASYMGKMNGTEQFIAAKLSKPEDAQYLRMKQRERDASGLQRAMKMAQMEADEKKVKENREKEAVRAVRRENKKAALEATRQNLILDTSAIAALSVKDLDRQLDYHREQEKTIDGHATVPMKKNMGKKAEKVILLQEAVARYKARLCQGASDDGLEERRAFTEVTAAGETDDKKCYLSDYHDDTI